MRDLVTFFLTAVAILIGSGGVLFIAWYLSLVVLFYTTAPEDH